MKKIALMLLAALLLISSFGCKKTEMIDQSIARETADKYIEDFVSGNYSGMVNDYKLSDKVASALSEEVLEKAWVETVQAALGSYLETSFIACEQNKSLYSFFYDVMCEKGVAKLLVSIDAVGAIAGLNVYNLSLNEPVSFDGLDVAELSFPASDGLSINATLISAKGVSGKAPIAIIVAGSGPNDRYGTVSVVNHPYADIAKALAENGINALIYDKRTYSYASDEKVSEKLRDITIYGEVVYDAVGAYNYAKGLDEVDKDKIYIIGHSLGGYCLPLIDESIKGDKPAGYIFLSAPSSRLEDLMLYQIKHLCSVDGTTDEEDEKTIASYEEGKNRVKGLTENNKADYTASELMGLPASYWLSLSDYNSVKRAEKLSNALFIGGTLDYQVPISELEAYETALKGKQDFVFCPVEGVNHLLMESNGSMSPEEYSIASHVSDKVIGEIISFIGK